MNARRWLLVATIASVLPCVAGAHSASDAYLTLTSDSDGMVVRGEWDVALRDLDFVLGIDADGDGKITWREFRSRRAAIEKYAYSKLVVRADGKACRVEPGKVQITDRADGAYAALFFEIVCQPRAKQLSLAYRLFFDIDPSHRGILIWHTEGGAATAVLSPSTPTIGVTKAGR